MTWAKFDDRTPSNPKVMLVSDAAFRLWFSSVCHCCEHLTDGFLDKEIPTVLPKAPSGAKLKKAIQELVDRGLWEALEDGGWEVHDFLDWNPSSEQVRAKKQARSEAGRRGGQKSGKARSKKEANDEAIASANAEQTGSKNEPRPRPRPRPQDPPVVPQGTEAADDSIQARAKKLTANPYDAAFADPSSWPEVVEAAGVIHQGLGFSGKPKLGRKDPGVNQVVELFAAGFTLEEIRGASPRLLGHKFLEQNRKIQCVTPSVLREIVDGASQPVEEAPWHN